MSIIRNNISQFRKNVLLVCICIIKVFSLYNGTYIKTNTSVLVYYIYITQYYSVLFIEYSLILIIDNDFYFNRGIVQVHVKYCTIRHPIVNRSIQLDAQTIVVNCIKVHIESVISNNIQYTIVVLFRNFNAVYVSSVLLEMLN